MTTDIIRERLSHLESDYYIYLAEIIEGNLMRGEEGGSKWEQDELPYWTDKLNATIAEIKSYQTHLEKQDEMEDILSWLGFDEKNGVREYIVSGMELLKSRIKQLECKVEAKEAIGLPTDSTESKKLLDYCRKLSKTRNYLNNFDEHFDNDIKVLSQFVLSQGGST